MLAGVLTGVSVAAAGVLAWGVRGRSSSLFAPSIWRGPRDRRTIALTFDDGPSESTGAVLELLRKHSARATFFQCGYHVRRLPDGAREVLAAGHEIGNHTDTHTPFYLRSAGLIGDEIARAQDAIASVTGVAPLYFRAPYGARWFGLREAQRKHQLTGVMWTSIARDWTLPAQDIVSKLRKAAHPGAIICFHDGRVLAERPDIRNTLGALSELLAIWSGEGYTFESVGGLLASANPQPAHAQR